MSALTAIKQFFNPNETQLNADINSSALCGFYCKITNFIKNRHIPDILTTLDTIYFIGLLILIYTIPFVSSGILGLLASILIVLSVISSVLYHKEFKFSAIHFPIFVYLAILLISVGFSSLFLPSLKGLAKMLIYIGSYFSFFEFLKRNPRKIPQIIAIIAISTSIELLFSLKQMIFGVSELAGWQDRTGVNPENMMKRVFGTLKPYNPNLFAAYLLAVVPSTIAASVLYFYKKAKKLSLILGIFGLLGIITIIQTGCRGAYIGLFFGVLLFLLLFFKHFKNLFSQFRISKTAIVLTLAGLIILGIIAASLSPAISHRLTSIFTFRGDSSNSYRMNVYISSLKMFLDNFWIGIGTGNTTYRLIYGLYMVTGYDALGAYNIYLEMAVESGIFALLTFLWMMLLTFIKGIKSIAKITSEYKIITITVLCALFSMLIHGFVDTVWYRPQLQLIFWLYMAIISVIVTRGFVHEQ